MIRAIAGTRVAATVSNALPNDTLLVHGLYARERGGKEGPPIELLPGESRTVEFVLDAPGTYYYWGTTMRRREPGDLRLVTIANQGVPLGC